MSQNLTSKVGVGSSGEGRGERFDTGINPVMKSISSARHSISGIFLRSSVDSGEDFVNFNQCFKSFDDRATKECNTIC